MGRTGRRRFFKSGATALAALRLRSGSSTLSATTLENFGGASRPPASPDGPGDSAPPFKLGLVTYELAKDWDVETIIKNCEATGFEGVELRTTHAHGVEPAISKERRAEVRKKFQDSKVRPNGFPKGVPHEKTLDQIGRALAKCRDIARDNGVEIWVEIHGEGTEDPANIRRIMDVANHPSVGLCWNSNDTDVEGGTVAKSFDLLKKWLRSCHINELWRQPAPWGASTGQPSEKTTPGFPSYAKPYPYHELFQLFRGANFGRYTFCEIPASAEPLRLMRIGRAHV